MHKVFEQLSILAFHDFFATHHACSGPLFTPEKVGSHCGNCIPPRGDAPEIGTLAEIDVAGGVLFVFSKLRSPPGGKSKNSMVPGLNGDGARGESQPRGGNSVVYGILRLYPGSCWRRCHHA